MSKSCNELQVSVYLSIQYIYIIILDVQDSKKRMSNMKTELEKEQRRVETEQRIFWELER